MRMILVTYLFLTGLVNNIQAQINTIVPVDSFQLQRANIQDTFLLRVIPEYIKFRIEDGANKELFPKKGVLVVIIPRNRSTTSVSYRIRTEYDNYYLLKLWASVHPLFYTKIGERYVIVCDEWTGGLTPISMSSQQKVIRELARSGWLNFITDPTEAMFESDSRVYTWQYKPNKE